MRRSAWVLGTGFFIASHSSGFSFGEGPKPTVLREGPYSFIFFSSDRSEPPHIHVKRDLQIAKFWLDPIALAKNRGFAEHELHRLEKMVILHRIAFLEAWHEYFGP